MNKNYNELLRNSIKQAKNIVVAPLIAGAMGSVTLLSTGQYILAIQCAIASGAITIIFVVTISISNKILDYI